MGKVVRLSDKRLGVEGRQCCFHLVDENGQELPVSYAAIDRALVAASEHECLAIPVSVNPVSIMSVVTNSGCTKPAYLQLV